MLLAAVKLTRTDAWMDIYTYSSYNSSRLYDMLLITEIFLTLPIIYTSRVYECVHPLHPKYMHANS